MKKLVFNFILLLFFFCNSKYISANDIITINGNFNKSNLSLDNKYMPFDTVFFYDTLSNTDLYILINGVNEKQLDKSTKYFIPTITGTYNFFYRKKPNNEIFFANQYYVLPYKINFEVKGRDSLCLGQNLLLNYSITGIAPSNYEIKCFRKVFNNEIDDVVVSIVGINNLKIEVNDFFNSNEMRV